MLKYLNWIADSPFIALAIAVISYSFVELLLKHFLPQ